MNASILPAEAASKHSNGCMIWPPGKTSIRNRPPLVSSTILASCRAAAWSWSRAGGNAVGIRHWTFDCAMTEGASTVAAAAAPMSTPPALTMNRRRSLIASSSPRDELMVGAFGDVVPRADERLELRERGVDLLGDGSLLGFFPQDLGRKLLE